MPIPSPTKQQLEAWNEDQLRIASQVKVLQDPLKNQYPRNFPGKEEITPWNFKPISGDECDGILYGGLDVSFSDTEGEPSVAVYVVVKDGEVVYSDYEFFHLSVPYVPSYLAFREIDVYVRLIAKQINDMAEMTPYVILVDGNGIMHERRAGIACFVGVRTGIRTVGVAKSFYNIDGLLRSEVRFNISEELYLFNKYIAEHDEESVAVPCRRLIAMKRLDSRDKSFVGTKASGPCKIVGATKPFPLALLLNGSSGITWGIALVGHGGVGSSIKRRSRDMKGSNTPLYISIGHNVSLEDALVFCVKQCLFKIPEPIRQADLRGREFIRNRRDVVS